MHEGGHPVDPLAVREEVTRQMLGWLEDKLAGHGGTGALKALVDQGMGMAGGQTAEVAGKTLTIPELLDLLTQQTALFDTAGPLRLAGGRTPAGLLVNAWRAVVFRQTRAATALVTQDLAQEALANARAALEHGALLAAADRARCAGQLEAFVAAVNDAGVDQAERHLTILNGLNDQEGGEHRAALKELASVVTEVKRPAAKKRWWDGEPGTLFKTLPDGYTAYSFYKVCSEATHAAAGSAMAYLGPAAIGGPIISTPIALHTAEMLAMLTWCLAQADVTMDGFIEQPRLQRHHLALFGLG